MEEYLPHFRCTICIGDRIKIPTHVLLDTGSPFTPILPKDYLRTRLRVPSTSTERCYLAKTQFYRVPTKRKVYYRFQTEDNKIVTIENENTIYLVPLNNDEINRVKAIPSILGVDFLKDNGLNFVFNPKEEIVYIEGTE